MVEVKEDKYKDALQTEPESLEEWLERANNNPVWREVVAAMEKTAPLRNFYEENMRLKTHNLELARRNGELEEELEQCQRQ